MAEKKNTIKYSEPDGYFPKEVRKMFETKTKKATKKTVKKKK